MVNDLKKPVAISAVALFILAMLSTIPSDSIDNSSYISKALMGTNCSQFADQLNSSMNILEIEGFVERNNCQLTKYAEKVKITQIGNETFIRLNDSKELDYRKAITLNKTRIKLSTNKIDFSYEFGTNNKLEDGKILDAGILTLTKSAVINPDRAFKYKKGQLKVHVEGNKSEVFIGNIYYLENETYSVTQPITKINITEKENCYASNVTKNTTICEKYNETEKVQIGTKQVKKTRTIKKYDYWNKLIIPNQDTIFYSDLRRSSPTDRMEVYFETLGYKDREHSWWNDDWDYYIQINVNNTAGELNNATINITLNETNFNYTHANTSGKDLRVLNSTNNLLTHYTDWDYNSTSILYFVVPILPNGSSIYYLYYGNPSANSTDNESIFAHKYYGYQLTQIIFAHGPRTDEYRWINSSGGNVTPNSINENPNNAYGFNLYDGTTSCSDVGEYFSPVGQYHNVTFNEPQVFLNLSAHSSYNGERGGLFNISFSDDGNNWYLMKQFDYHVTTCSWDSDSWGYSALAKSISPIPEYTLGGETQDNAFNTSVSISPSTPAINGTLNCTAQANSSGNTSFQLDIYTFRNGVNITDLAYTNSSYSNGTEWSVQIPLNSSINMESDEWKCGAYADDGANTAQANSSSVTTSYENALILSTQSNIFNSSKTIASATNNFNIVQDFIVTNPFNFLVDTHTFSTYTAIAAGAQTAEFRLYDDTNNTALATTQRTMSANSWGSGALSSGGYDIGALENMSTLFEFRRTFPSFNDLTIANVTSLIKIFADSSTNQTINHTNIEFENTTTSTTPINIYEQNFTFDQRGYPIISLDKVSLSSTADTRVGYNLEVDGTNCSMIYRNVSAGGSGLGAAYCIGANKVTGNTPVNVKMFAQTEAGTLTVNFSGTAHPHTTSEAGQVNLTGKSFNSSTFVSIANITDAPLLAGRDLLVLASFSTNSTNADINTSYKLRLYNSTDEQVNESVEMQRTLSANSDGIANLIYTFDDLTFQTHTLELLAKNDQASNVTITGGSVVAFTTSDTALVQQNVTCGVLGVENREYDLDMNLTSNSTCFTVTSPNITLNCNGYSITGNNTLLTYGVYSDQYNTTVKNCVIANFSNDIYINGGSYANITDNNLTTTITTGCGGGETYDCRSILLKSSPNGYIADNDVVGIDQAIMIHGGSFSTAGNNTIIKRNRISNSYSGAITGIYLLKLYNATISDNNVTMPVGTILSEFGGNHIITNNSVNATVHGCIEFEYSTNNIIQNNTIYSPGFGFYLTGTSGNSYLNNNVTASTWIYDEGSSSGNTFNDSDSGNIYYFANGTGAWEIYNIWTDDGTNWSKYGTDLPFNSSLTEWTGSGEDWHPFTENSLGCGELSTPNSVITMDNSVSIDNSSCFTITAENVTLDCNGYSIIGDNSSVSFGVFTSATNSTIENCTINSFETGIGTNSTQTLAHNNNITTIYWINDSGSSNYFNTTGQGNIYYFTNGTGAWEVFRIYNNGSTNWAVSGLDRPFNSSTVSPYWIGSDEDWHPYTVNEDELPYFNELNLTPLSVADALPITCFANVTDNLSSSLLVEYEVYANGVNQTALAGSTNLTNNTNTTLEIITANLTTEGQDWICSARVYDGLRYTSWQNSSTATITSDINLSLSNGITEIYFNPHHGFQTNVSPTNQTATKGLFNVTNLLPSISYNVSMYLNDSRTGITVVCSRYANQTNLLTLNTSAQRIATLSGDENSFIFCWANYNNPTGSTWAPKFRFEADPA